MFKKRKSIRINNKKLMYSMLIFVLIGIATMTIAYATLSTTLKITGSAEFEDASWGLLVEENYDTSYYEWEDDGFSLDGNIAYWGNVDVLKKPTISGTTLSDLRISIKGINSGADVLYKITNVGEVPAMFDSIVWSTPRYTSSTNDQNDIDLVQENLYYDYGMWEIFEVDGEWSDGVKLTEGDILCPGAMASLELYVGFYGPRIPYYQMTVSNISANINFVAADQNLCNGDTPVTPNSANDSN